MEPSTSRDLFSASRGRLLPIALGALGVLFVVSLNLTPIYSNDFWLQLKVGEIVLETGSIPRTVLFSFTEARDFPFYAHEWLPSVGVSALFQVVGIRGIVVFKCAMALVISGLAAALSLQINRDREISLLVACLCILGINFRTVMRPEIFAFALLLVELNLLEAFARTGSWKWLLGLPAVGALWANSHGSFLVGLAIPPLFLAGAVLNRWFPGPEAGEPAERAGSAPPLAPLVLVSAAVAAASLLNPYGVGLLIHSFSLSQSAYIRENIYEWLPTFSDTVAGFPLFKVYLFHSGALILSMLIGWRRIEFTSMILFLVFGVLSVDAVRHTAWFAVVGSYVMARALTGVLDAGRRRAVFSAFLIAALAAGSAFAFARGNVRGDRPGFRDAAPLTPGAIRFLRESGIRGNVLNSYLYGDQLIYHFFPEIRVAVDSRLDAYGEQQYRRFRSLSGRSHELLGEPSELMAFLERYRVETIVARPGEVENWRRKGHLEALERGGWKPVYRDAKTRILRREPSAAGKD